MQYDVVSLTTPDMDPKNLLKTWLSDQGVKPAEFARRIEYDKSNFHRLINEPDVWPTLEVAFRIDRETGGQVPTTSWAVAKARLQDEAA